MIHLELKILYQRTKKSFFHSKICFLAGNCHLTILKLRAYVYQHIDHRQHCSNVNGVADFEVPILSPCPKPPRSPLCLTDLVE